MRTVSVLIGANIACFFLQNLIPYAHAYFGLNRLFVDALFLWQPLTSMFMHGGLTHLAMNMVVLFQFGTILERSIGTKPFLKLYLLGGILTSLLSFFFFYVLSLPHVLVGASGAISVLIGVIARHEPHYRKGLVVALLLISFAPLLLGFPIAWYAHLFGFGVGWFWRFRP